MANPPECELCTNEEARRRKYPMGQARSQSRLPVSYVIFAPDVCLFPLLELPRLLIFDLGSAYHFLGAELPTEAKTNGRTAVAPKRTRSRTRDRRKKPTEKTQRQGDPQHSNVSFGHPVTARTHAKGLRKIPATMAAVDESFDFSMDGSVDYENYNPQKTVAANPSKAASKGKAKTIEETYQKKTRECFNRLDFPLPVSSKLHTSVITP